MWWKEDVLARHCLFEKLPYLAFFTITKTSSNEMGSGSVVIGSSGYQCISYWICLAKTAFVAGLGANSCSKQPPRNSTFPSGQLSICPASPVSAGFFTHLRFPISALGIHCHCMPRVVYIGPLQNHASRPQRAPSSICRITASHDITYQLLD